MSNAIELLGQLIIIVMGLAIIIAISALTAFGLKLLWRVWKDEP